MRAGSSHLRLDAPQSVVHQAASCCDATVCSRRILLRAVLCCQQLEQGCRDHGVGPDLVLEASEGSMSQRQLEILPCAHEPAAGLRV